MTHEETTMTPPYSRPASVQCRRSAGGMTLLVLVATVAAALVSLVTGTSGAASARPAEAPRLAIAGDDIWTLGNHDNCRGPIRVSVKTDPRQPGKVFTTYHPGRFTGDGPGWARNPVCKVRVQANWTFPAMLFASKPVIAGPRGGAPVTQVLRTGPGLFGMGFATPYPHKPVSYYLLVP